MRTRPGVTATSPHWSSTTCSAAISCFGKVYAVDGEHQGFHWWNRLVSGVEIDLTRGQFRNGQRIAEVRAVKRPAGRPKRRGEEYERLRRRVAARIGPLPAWIPTGSGETHEPQADHIPTNSSYRTEGGFCLV